jgi:drug/metabolite transporter (DMT)-like permease
MVSTPLLIITLSVAGLPIYRAVPAQDWIVLLLSGILGIAVADTLFHKSLNIVGAGVTAIIDTLYSPLVVVQAHLLLAERIGLWDLVGMGLIIAAVFISTTVRPPEGRTRRDLVRGILIGLVGIAFLTFSIVLAKPVLNRSPVLWAASVRQFGSLVVLLAVGLLSSRRREIFAVLRPSPAWRTTLPATLLGSYLALILWIAGNKHTMASIAAILNQSATIFILVLAVIFLREPISRRKLLAAMLAMVGIVLVALR